MTNHLTQYLVHEIEKKWQTIWAKNNPIYSYKLTDKNKKYYCLDMFPYPSGAGLHVGHWRGYILSDVYARIKLLEGYNLLHPMGWDAFGLPAENDAIKKNIQPKISTAQNIANFKQQLQATGAIYNWDKELDTTDPEYYKWTQWIFLQMFKAGLAYEDFAAINWCPACLTGLANEEVVNGNCERCGTLTIQKSVRQWILKITDYAEKLLTGLDNLPHWPENVKTMQRNWIGKSEGLLFSAKVKDLDLYLQTFSTHFEAFEADSFVVIAPDHKLLKTLTAGIINQAEILNFCEKIITNRTRDKYLAEQQTNIKPENNTNNINQNVSGIFTGRYLEDPVSGQDLPIWVASFAIADYGTGIVKCSAHDPRDFVFAKKYNIPLKVVLVPEVLTPADLKLRQQVENLELCFNDTHAGILLAPAEFAGQRANACRAEIIDYCERKKFATKKISYRLRDWVFSRQRYWGEPIPLVHCETCGIVPVPEDQLPIRLPEVDKYQPTGTGESPLAAITDWVNTSCPKCAGPAKRETNTMPQWAGSCWYFLRYPNPDLNNLPFDPQDLKFWLPVDLYVGGIEHAILHLLYARFYIKVLHDLKYLEFNEPFKQLFNQGMVCKLSEKSGLVEKMSKSKGNVVNPDEIVRIVGSDALRLYILFMGPPELDCEWQDAGLEGLKRFLQRLWNYFTDSKNIISEQQETELTLRATHKLIKTFQERLNNFKPNTAIAAYMEWLNYLQEHKLQISKTSLEKLLILISPMAPHFASELLEKLLSKSLDNCTWPTFDPSLTIENQVELIIQINGKLRGKLTVPVDSSQQIVEHLAAPLIDKWLGQQQIIKIIFVPNKIINFVIK